MAEIQTVKSQLNATLTLLEDVSETICRFETHLSDLNTQITSFENGAFAEENPDASAIANDAAELRSLIISLKQQLEKSFSSDIEPLAATLKYLHHEGIPQLVENASALTVTVQAFQNSIPLLKDSVNSVVANLAPIKADTEAAGRFASSFQEPMQELLGRDAHGRYVEDKFILRNMARVVFSLTGKDEFGKPKEGAHDRLSALLDEFFKKNYMRSDGSKMSRWETIGESFLDYVGTNIWQRVFDIIILGVLWLLIVNPAARAIQEVAATSEKHMQSVVEKVQPPKK